VTWAAWLLPLYLAVGVGMAAWCQGNRPGSISPAHTIYLCLLWPRAAWNVARVLLADAEVAALSWLLGVVTRRLARRGCRFTVE
jgi:hypothetical protein